MLERRESQSPKRSLSRSQSRPATAATSEHADAQQPPTLATEADADADADAERRRLRAEAIMRSVVRHLRFRKTTAWELMRQLDHDGSGSIDIVELTKGYDDVEGRGSLWKDCVVIKLGNVSRV